MDMVFFQEVLFTLALWFLVCVILVMFSHNFSVTAVTSSSNNDSKKRGVYVKNLASSKNDEKTKELRIEKVVGENPIGDIDIIGTAASAEMIKKTEQVASKEIWDTTYVTQIVGADNKSCYLTPKFREFEVESMYFVEEVPEEPGFQEIENNPSEKNGVKKQEDDVHVEKDEDDEGLLGEWEGIERTELEKLFGAAVVFVDSIKSTDVLDNELKMQLYGLHKVATEGPCYGRQPMPFKLSARAKWSSWHELGDMKREKAMEQYVALLSDRVADWKIDKTDQGNYELISPDIETSQDSSHFFTQVAL